MVSLDKEQIVSQSLSTTFWSDLNTSFLKPRFLISFHICSIGFISGVYGGIKTSSIFMEWPTFSMYAAMYAAFNSFRSMIDPLRLVWCMLKEILFLLRYSNFYAFRFVLWGAVLLFHRYLCMRSPIDLPFYLMCPIFELFRHSSSLLLKAVRHTAVCQLFCLLLFFLLLLFQLHFLRWFYMF